MIRSRLAQFSLDERARVPIQFLSQTVGIAAIWVIARNWVAPLLGIRVLGPIELTQTVTATAIQTTLSGASPPPSFSLIELMVGPVIWMLPVFVVLGGIVTVLSALWYGVDRWIRPSVAGETGGESA